jgi:hypothetical protein
MQFLLKNVWSFAGALLGAVGGFTYYKLVGCSLGHCAITSNPFNSTIYGAVMGGLFLNIIKDLYKNK